MNKESHALEDLARRFEAVCRSAGDVDLRQFLEDNGVEGEASGRASALTRLIPIDMACRWKRGEVNSLDHYLDDFPELGPAEQLPAEFIFKEYRVRHAHGDKPELETYRLRFPQQYAELERLVRRSDNMSDSPSLGDEKTLRAVPVNKETQKGSPPSEAAIKPPSAFMSGMSGTSGAVVPIGQGYHLLKRIGSGGFGEVWRAENAQGIPAAVKIIFRSMDHEDAKREKDALELIKTLRHPFLIQTRDFVQLEDRLFIVMELADGNLRDRLKECRQQGLNTIPLKELFTYFRDASEALDYLHSRHLQHRDIKPDNLMLLEGHAKLADFGLARVLEQSMHTATGSGTPPYMAPEIWMGKVSEHSDQYALACTYAELRLNRRLFQSAQLREMMLDHLERTPDLSELPEAEQKVILKALSKEPEDRYPHCRDFIRDLERAIAPLLRSQPGDGPGIEGDWETLPPDARTHRMEGQVPGMTGSVQVTVPVPEPSLSRRAFIAAAIGLPFAGAGVGIAWYFWTRRIWLPAGYKKADEAHLIKLDNGFRVYDRIDYVFDDGERVRFLLMTQDKEGQPDPFYIMENKVWNELYERFINDPKSAEILAPFQTIAPWTVKMRWKDGGVTGLGSEKENLGIKDPRWPVLNVTVVEAHCFARWLGGYLPTTRQWDKAGGGMDGQSHPYDAPDTPTKEEVAIKRGDVGPMAVGTATRDRSIFDCRDMAGNGQEWTRDVEVGNSGVFREVPILEGLPSEEPNAPEYGVVLRGASYSSSEPFSFEVSTNSISGRSERRAYGAASPIIGFRVVLEIR